VSPDDWTQTQGELRSLRDFKAQQDKLLEMKEAERIKTLAEKGQLNEALKQLNENYTKKIDEYAAAGQAVEREWLEDRRSRAIDEVLAGRAFTGVDPTKTAAMVRQLLTAEVEAVRDASGKPVIRDKLTMRPAAEYLRERLESPEFGVFFVAQNKGGSGADASRPAGADTNGSKDPNAIFAAQFLKTKKDAMNARF